MLPGSPLAFPASPQALELVFLALAKTPSARTGRTGDKQSGTY